MERWAEYVKSSVVNYKLQGCCFLFPVRTGCFILAYLNIVLAVISIIGTMNDSFSPNIKQVQDTLMPDNENKTVCVLAYATELGFYVLLLCAMYRRVWAIIHHAGPVRLDGYHMSLNFAVLGHPGFLTMFSFTVIKASVKSAHNLSHWCRAESDVVLLRLFIYCCTVTVILSIMIYSIVIVAIDVLIKLRIILSVALQCYTILLVRSEIVEIKHRVNINKNGTSVTYLYKTGRDDIEELPPRNVPKVDEPTSITKTEAVNPKQNIITKNENITEASEEKFASTPPIFSKCTPETKKSTLYKDKSGSTLTKKEGTDKSTKKVDDPATTSVASNENSPDLASNVATTPETVTSDQNKDTVSTKIETIDEIPKESKKTKKGLTKFFKS